MSASRLQQAADALGVAVPFFFERAEGGPYKPAGNALSATYIDDFVSSADGLRLAKAFTRIPRVAMRSCIVGLVNEITGGDGKAAS